MMTCLTPKLNNANTVFCDRHEFNLSCTRHIKTIASLLDDTTNINKAFNNND